MALVVVERAFDDPASFDELQARETEGAWCLDMHNVKFLQTYFSADRKTMICLYEAPDSESVRVAQNRIGMPFERVWTARLFDPSGQDDFRTFADPVR